MKGAVYNWKRYWVPRDGRFSFDSEGFLLAPANDALRAKYWRTDVVGFDDILLKPCLVLLGEPGIGKSFAIQDAANRMGAARTDIGATMLFRNLGSYSSDSLLVEDVFKSVEFSSWLHNGGEFHIFLDSFDECLLRVDAVAELLAAQFIRISSIQNLFLRIASRTAEWRTSLEDALRKKWQNDAVGVYELAPLTRAQVFEAAKVHLPEPDRFIEAIIANEVVSFAIKPLTLDLLIRIWKKRCGSLPPTQREIYEQGCLELCRDSEDRQTPKLRRQHTAEHRLAVATHVAAATFFCNRNAVWTGASQTDKPESDISLAELAIGSITLNGQSIITTETVLMETLDSGLFTSRGRNRLGWAHQTYGEFLAARYLTQEGLNPQQAFDLLSHPHDPDRKLIPQLQETAAWAAKHGSELFSHLMRVQPDILLRSDVATADDRDKYTLVEALITSIANDVIHGDWWGMRRRYRKLLHSRLAKQLRRHLLNRKLEAYVRLEVISMAEACEVNILLRELLTLALDAGEVQSVRQLAAAVVSRSADSHLKKYLRPLALGQAGADPDNELRGAGLVACWPQHMTVDDLFFSLKEPYAGCHGLYRTFLSNQLTEKLAAKDIPKALAWAESQPENRGDWDVGFTTLISQIFDRAVLYIEDNTILQSLAKAILSRLRKHDFSHGVGASHLPHVLETQPEIRLKLTEVMVTYYKDSDYDAMLMTRGGLRLVRPPDLPWLIEHLQTTSSPGMRQHFAHLLGWVFYPDNVQRIDAVIEASEQYPALVEVMPGWLKPMVTNSEEARKARESHLEEQRHREQFERCCKRKRLSPTPAEWLITLLNQFEGGDMDAWWKLCNWLEVKDDGYFCEKHYYMDIRELLGWKNATDTTKARIVAAAERYVCEHGPRTEDWFSRRNIQYLPAIAGFRALLLLAYEKPLVCDALSRDVWQKWMPVILRFYYYDELSGHYLLVTKAFDRAPNDAIKWTVKTLNEENKEGDSLWILNKLPEKWDCALGNILLAQLKQIKLKPPCFGELLMALLKHCVAGALSFARQKIPRKVPANTERRDLALRTAGLLMIHGERGDWHY